MYKRQAPRGRQRPDTRDATIARLTKEKTRLERELARTRFVVDVQAKLQALLEKAASTGGRNDPCVRLQWCHVAEGLARTSVEAALDAA